MLGWCSTHSGDWFGCFMPLLTSLQQTSPIPPNSNYIVLFYNLLLNFLVQLEFLLVNGLMGINLIFSKPAPFIE